MCSVVGLKFFSFSVLHIDRKSLNNISATASPVAIVPFGVLITKHFDPAKPTENDI